MTNWSCNVLRACGIPTIYEFTPKWTDRDNRHFWCVSPDSIGYYNLIPHQIIISEKIGKVILNMQERYTVRPMEHKKILLTFGLMKMNLFQKVLGLHYLVIKHSDIIRQ